MTPINGLADLLWRNEGQRLTPELIAGVLVGADYLERQEQALATPDVPIPLPDINQDPALLRPSHLKLTDDAQRVAEFVANQAGCSAACWAGYVGLGLEDASGQLVAGVVLESYNGRNANAHVAGVGKHWLNRNLLFHFFHYAFNVLGLQRLTGLVPASNQAAQRFDEHLGFKLEYAMPDGAKDGDLNIYVMRREDCRFLPKGEVDYGR